MPFTFAHPAIVLPLINKRWKLFSTTTLIAGSIAPDFESFIGLGSGKLYSHTWPGIFWFDLPITLLLSLVFHTVVKKPLIDNLSTGLVRRFGLCRDFDWVAYANTHFWIVISSALIGSLSHLLWDSFTHLNMYYPDSITSRIKWHGHRVYILLQYVNSIVGLVAVALYIYKVPAKNIVVHHSGEKYKFWMFCVLVAAVIATFVFTTLAEEVWLLDKIYLINVGIGSFMYSLIIVSLFNRYVVPLLPN